MKIVTAAQMKALDEKMIRDHAIGALALMEKAGSGVADVILTLLEQNQWLPKVIFFAGKGNNAGDAFVAARLLEGKGVKTQTFLLSSLDEVKGEAKENLKKLKSAGGHLTEVKSGKNLAELLSNVEDVPIVVDGIVGTGSKGRLQGLFAEAADLMNSKNFLATVAIDIPSGLDLDEGYAGGTAVQADHTVTLGLPKRGLVSQKGLEWTGTLHVIDLGIPDVLIKETDCHEFLLFPKNLSLPLKRKRLSHKGTYGHLLILGGSLGLTGAPSLAALAALRSGAGLVTVGIPESLNSILEVKLTEPMTLPLPEAQPGFMGLKALDRILEFLKRSNALVIGPGLGTHEETAQLVQQLVQRVEIPMVIDADGLNVLAHDVSFLKKAKAPIILTPHPGEMGRLIGQSSEEVQSHRWEVARMMAKEFNVITILKGAGTVVVAPEGSLFINVTGHPGMATGGMGDLLSGMLGGLIAQGMDPLESAKLGVYLHGACGDEVSSQLGFEQGLLASDLLGFIPRKLKEIRRLKRGV
jgi:NAD(P)H-hydrate epimerase